MATLKLDLFQINVSSSSNGQVLTSNGTQAYWSTSIGYAGSVGATGFTGSIGGTGYTGSKGDSGYVGSAGYTGSVGNFGYTGSKGDTGYTGSAGYTGSQGPAGEFGGAAFNYIYSTNTTHTSSPNGYFNFTNTTFSSVNTLSIDYIDNYGANVYSFLQTIDDSTSAIKGHFSIRDTANDLNYVLFSIVGTHTEHTDHFDVPVSYLSGVTSFTNGTNTVITFARTGNIGDTGYTGSIGTTGYSGSIGFTGSTGTGYTGSIGSLGYTGSTGSLGYTGSSGSSSGGTTVTVSATAPVSPTANSLWWNSESGTLYIYYNDGDTSQWVATSSQGAVGYAGSTGSIGFTGSGGVSTGKSIAMSMIFGG